MTVATITQSIWPALDAGALEGLAGGRRRDIV